MRFKAWLYNEIEVGSDGTRDNQATQTSQATEKSSQFLQQSPKFSDRQTNWMDLSGNPSSLNKTFLKDVGWGMDKIVPPKIGGATNAGNVAFKMSLDSPIQGLKIPKPKMFGMKKMMLKRMKKS